MARRKKPSKKFASTKQALSKVENAPNLFIHDGTGIYYARSRRGGKDLLKCLETKNRREADAALQDWFKEIATPKGKAGSFRVLLDNFLTVRELLADKTQENDKHVVELFKEHYPDGVDIPASRVITSRLIAWVTAWAGTKEEPKIKAATYNRYRSSVKQIFQTAVNDGVYPEDKNPFRANSIPKRKIDEIIRLIPSEAEFQAIIAHVRGQKYNAEKDKTGDFLEFMGRVV